MASSSTSQPRRQGEFHPHGWRKGLGNLPWRNFSKMSLVHTPYGIFGSSTSEKFPCKPVKDSISSNSVGEMVGKSPVAELLEDVIGAHALRHLRKLRLRKISLQAHERLHLL
jgi:hypothetical protein